jgi:hypothetical protein
MIRQLAKLKDVLQDAREKRVVQIADDTIQVYQHGYLIATYYIDRTKTTSEAGWEESYMIKRR